jgi:hypothetical protein
MNEDLGRVVSDFFNVALPSGPALLVKRPSRFP